MAVKKLRLDGIGNYAEDVIEQSVDSAAANLFQRLRDKSNVPIREGTMRTRWKIRKVSNLESELVNNLEYAEPVTFGTNLPPTWKNGYQLTTADGTPIPKEWASIAIEKTKRDILKELRSL